MVVGIIGGAIGGLIEIIKLLTILVGAVGALYLACMGLSKIIGI